MLDKILKSLLGGGHSKRRRYSSSDRYYSRKQNYYGHKHYKKGYKRSSGFFGSRSSRSFFSS
ncbi:hypothetical protein D1B33_16290 [Lysinibacillus yapensis]|uniref:Uncharacterized protein n=1 Tax=Ureibacillus yapensis TaxID=2304605 RepID=A0A396SB29_9BACL|nr:hypothetical protein [Lysinibacillus yapensis]RHW32727.1 hypothetical protein D1B33_16290 [Lysinibacillus yapensis]